MDGRHVSPGERGVLLVTGARRQAVDLGELVQSLVKAPDIGPVAGEGVPDRRGLIGCQGFGCTL
jgi:hypothetical protein